MMREFMMMALEAALGRLGYCAPNPSVGVVVVKDGRVLAVGRHWACGCPHAEVDALDQLGEEAVGADIYVTLEPCCHYGRTPPCTELLIKRGIACVYYGLGDPNPAVAGEGVAQLEAANVRVEQVLLPEIIEFYQSYVYWWQHHRPWVTAKIALSRDGKIAGPDGVTVMMTGEECRRLTHEWRSRSDALLTTARTIIKDDPQLNVRLDGEVVAKPVYVLDRQLNLSLQAKIINSASEVTVFYEKSDVHKINQLQSAGVRLIQSQDWELSKVIEQIGEDGVHALWVEAGGRCFQALVENNLLHRAFIYHSPMVLGEESLTGFSPSFDPLQFAQHVEWRDYGVDRVAQLTFVSGSTSC